VSNNIELARYYDENGNQVSITIQNYIDFVEAENKNEISNFVYQRLYSRYLKPFSYNDEKYKKEYKNGFSIMANCCLLIETLQSFKNGWGDSDRKSLKAFKQFLSTDKNFAELNTRGQSFYEHIRCGILHQGETTGGWKINREGSTLFDEATLTINATEFAKRLETSLKEYSQQLNTEKWDSELWDNLRTKMRKVISNSHK
jgi:hypothetical protein